jgi:hypothetical protein
MSSTRRAFLGGITGAVYLPSAVATPQRLKPLLAPVPPATESYWKLVAGQFPVRQGKIMMNAANLCPAPRSVADRVAELARDIDSDVSFQNRAKFAAMLEESRKKTAEHLHVSDDEVSLVRNTSEANNIINNGVPLKAGDEVSDLRSKSSLQQCGLGCASRAIRLHCQTSGGSARRKKSSGDCEALRSRSDGADQAAFHYLYFQHFGNPPSGEGIVCDGAPARNLLAC